MSHFMTMGMGKTEEIDESEYLDETDYAILDFIKGMEERPEGEEPPAPTPYQISTHSTTCYIGSDLDPECEQAINFGFIVDYFPKYILDNMLFREGAPFDPASEGYEGEAPFCPFHGFKMDGLEIRFDTMYTHGKKAPLVKINGVNMWDPVGAPEESKRGIHQYFRGTTIEYTKKGGRQKKERDVVIPGIRMVSAKASAGASLCASGGASGGASLRREMHLLSGEEVVAEETRSVTSEDILTREYEHMYNSCSIIVQSTPTSKPVNIILWNNGSMTITGCLYAMDGEEAGRTLLNHLKGFPHVFGGIKKLDMEAKTKSARKKNKILYPLPSEDFVASLEIKGYNITMINSKYSVGFQIDLPIFYEILKDEIPDLFVIYDTEDYRGLQISYFWSRARTGDGEQTGICSCRLPCSAKKISKKCFSPFKIKQVNNQDLCKKVTISIFKSGKIIITGANREEQIRSAYDYLNSVIRRYYQRIVKVSIEDIVANKTTTTYSIMQECDRRFGIESTPTKVPVKAPVKAKAPTKAKAPVKAKASTKVVEEKPSVEIEVMKKVRIRTKKKDPEVVAEATLVL